MAATLNNTLSSETANSYCDLAYSTDYFANHFNVAKAATWASFTPGQQAQALIQACWTLEQVRFVQPQAYSSRPGQVLQYNIGVGAFTGYINATTTPAKYDFYQALQFPRNKDVRSDGSIFIPDRVMMAQCEQAIYLASFDDSAMSSSMQGISLDKIALGNGAIELTQEFTSGAATSTLAPLALDYIKPYVLYNIGMQRS